MTKYLIVAWILAFCTFAFFQIEKSDGVEYRKIIAGHMDEIKALTGRLAETEAKLTEAKLTEAKLNGESVEEQAEIQPAVR